MEKFKLTSIKRYTNDKQGQPLKTKDGRDYTRVNIQVAQHGQKWVSGFGSNTNANWKDGDEVELIIDIKKVGDKEYLNFKEPKKIDAVDEKLEKILNKITQMNLILESMRQYVMPKKEQAPVPYNPEELGEYPENNLGEPQF